MRELVAHFLRGPIDLNHQAKQQASIMAHSASYTSRRTVSRDRAFRNVLASNGQNILANNNCQPRSGFVQRTRELYVKSGFYNAVEKRIDAWMAEANRVAVRENWTTLQLSGATQSALRQAVLDYAYNLYFPNWRTTKANADSPLTVDEFELLMRAVLPEKFPSVADLVNRYNQRYFFEKGVF